MAASDFARNYARLLRASSIRTGGVRVRGVPAILLGVSAVILTAGTARVLRAAVPALPELVRESTKLVEALRAERSEARRLTG